MSHHIGLLIIIVITVLLVPSTKSAECPGSVFGNHCYVILTDVSQWEESKLSCDQQYGGHQSIIDSQDQADFLADLARREDSESIWINARKDEQHWHWLEDGEDVSIQGCYADSSQEADLPYMVYIDDMTPDLCVEECRMEHYLYAGLQDGDKCFCGDNFGRYGQVTSSDVEWCTSDCAGDRDQNCGGRHLNMIYKVDGAYGVWAFRQPNNWSGHQDCGALASIDDQYKFGDENCYELMYYLCDIGCSDDSSSLCMYVSDEEVTWFDARADCLERGGELTSILSEPRHAELSDFLYENGHSLEKHWIGLTKFQWLDQHDVPLSFTDFADRSPNQEDANCLVMSNEHNYRWIDEMCSEERATICQIDDTTNRRTSTIIYPNRETPTPTPTPTPSNTPVIFSPHGSTPSLSPLIRSTTPQLGVTSSNQSASSPGYEITNNETIEYGNSTAGDENSTDTFSTKAPNKQEQEIVNSDSEAATGIKGEFLKLSLFDILLLAVLLALAVGIFSCAIVFAVFKRNHRTNQISDNKAVEQTDEVKAPPTDLFTTNASRANQYKGSMRRLTEYPDDDGTTC